MTQVRNQINPFDKKRMQVQNQNVTQEKNPSPSQQKAEINAPAMQNASKSLAGKKKCNRRNSGRWHQQGQNIKIPQGPITDRGTIGEGCAS